jgi:hypothetical protein
VVSSQGRSSAAADDRAAIAAIVRAFFAAFVSGADCTARLGALGEAFLPEAVIIRTCGGTPTVSAAAWDDERDGLAIQSDWRSMAT